MPPINLFWFVCFCIIEPPHIGIGFNLTRYRQSTARKKSKLSLFFIFLHSIALCQGYLNALARHQRSWVGDEIQISFSVVGSLGNLPPRRPPFWAVGSVQFAMCILPRMICPFFNIYVFSSVLLMINLHFPHKTFCIFHVRLIPATWFHFQQRQNFYKFHQR